MRRFAINTVEKRLAAGLCPDPLAELTEHPRPISWINGEREGVEGRGREGEGGRE